ncbi:hypothetical protein [uncultured Vagococcus sp.]|uniref:hypothetical protein n=1 Tax=uncultured Vagococcus sp. TaxID=189676 RepID=UPI0028CFED23|nr:hypothetical protein [uncultured Vagococcus sp.]
MTLIIGNTLNGIRQWLTKKRESQQIIKAAEIFFFVLPTLFLLYHYLMALLSEQDFFHLLVSHPAYTIQFMTYVSYYFVSLLLRVSGKLTSMPQEIELLKVCFILILISQLLSLNMVVTAVVLMVIGRLFKWDVLRINYHEVLKSQHKWLLALGCFLVVVSGALALVTAVLPT